MSDGSITPFSTANRMLLALHRREISAVELLELRRRRVEQLNGKLNSIILCDFERARRDAAEADARRAHGDETALLGLPITVKESIDVRGTPSTAGVPERTSHRAACDALTVRRLREAGAVIFGKTNVCTWLSDFHSDNAVYGRTNNPWDLSRTSGGSSGGSAAVAAGLCHLDLGSDMGGSIRVPPAFCGIWGHKPSESLVPNSGHFPGSTGPQPAALLAAQGPQARSAADLELVLDVIAGPDVGMDTAWRVTLPPARRTRISEFRVAVLPLQRWLTIDPEILGALDDLANELSAAGALVSELQPPGLGDLREYYALFRSMMSSIVSARWTPEHRQRAIADKRARDDEFHAADATGFGASAGDFIQWHEQREIYRAAYRDFFREWDILLTPMTPVTAFEHTTASIADRRLQVLGREMEAEYLSFYPGVSTLAGHPSTAFPAGFTSAGLPIGLQAIGPYLEDRTPLRFAHLVEQMRGGFVAPPKFAL